MTFEWPSIDALVDVLPRGIQDADSHPVLEVLAQAVTPMGLAAVFRNLQFGGLAIPRTPEAETAAALYFMLGHALRHGPNWRTTMVAELREYNARGQYTALQACGFKPALDFVTHRLHKGKPKRADIPTRAVLEAVKASWTPDGLVYPTPSDRLMRRFECCEKVAYAAMSRGVDQGYLDYGTTLRWPHLTAEGRAYLEETA